MDYRAVNISNVWLSIAIISAVYMWLFADKIGDILFGVFLPVGLLVLVAFILTIVVLSHTESEKK
jgi:tellurite resistance protein TehA-like permease